MYTEEQVEETVRGALLEYANIKSAECLRLTKLIIKELKNPPEEL